jgi:hypothetical protein
VTHNIASRLSHAIETIGTLDNVRLWAALMAADADTDVTSDS